MQEIVPATIYHPVWSQAYSIRDTLFAFVRCGPGLPGTLLGGFSIAVAGP
jgi:hypothetical protein